MPHDCVSGELPGLKEMVRGQSHIFPAAVRIVCASALSDILRLWEMASFQERRAVVRLLVCLGADSPKKMEKLRSPGVVRIS